MDIRVQLSTLQAKGVLHKGFFWMLDILESCYKQCCQHTSAYYYNLNMTRECLASKKTIVQKPLGGPQQQK